MMIIESFEKIVSLFSSGSAYLVQSLNMIESRLQIFRVLNVTSFATIVN